jgi:hypothetical protein
MTLLNISFNGLWIYKNILSLKYKIQHVPIQVQCICILRHEKFVSNKYFAIPLSYFDWWDNLKDMEIEVKKEWLLRVHAIRNQTEGTRDSKPMVIFPTLNG